MWTIGWIVATLFAVSIGKDHRKDEIVDQPIVISQPANGKMTVTVSEPALSYTGQFDWINNGEGWDLTEDTMKLSNVDFGFKKSEDSAFHVVLRRFSFGRSKADAETRASKIGYNIVSKDSVLDIGNGFSIDRNSKFRWQHVLVEIRIPVGKKIRFDNSVNRKLNPGDFDFDREDEWRKEYGRHYYFRYLNPETDYIMGADGTLKDEFGKKAREDERYRYDDNNDTIRARTERSQERESYLRIRKKKSQTDVACGPPSPIVTISSTIN